MWYIRELDPFFVCFHLFGQTAYIPSKLKYMKQLLISSIVFKLIHFSLAFAYAFKVVTSKLNNSVKDTSFNSYVLRYVGVHFFLINGLVLYKSIVSPFSSYRICQHFARVIENMQFYLKVQFRMNNFKRSFLQKILSYLSVLLFQCALHSILNQPDNYSTYILTPVNIFAAFYIILFVDLINFSLNSINAKLEECLCFKQPYVKVIILFQYVKWIHFNLWKISKILNNDFGLMLIIITLHYFIWIVLSSYYMFLVWPRDEIASK